jgi:hypothetical protein
MDYQLIVRPGVYHPMIQTSLHTPAQERWFDETCDLVESVVEQWEPAGDPQRLQRISLAVHVLADHLYEEQGGAPEWGRLDPQAFYEFLSGQVALADPKIPPLWPRLYRLLVLVGRVEAAAGAHLIAQLEALAGWPPVMPSLQMPNRKSLGKAARRMQRWNRRMS